MLNFHHKKTLKYTDVRTKKNHDIMNYKKSSKKSLMTLSAFDEAII